MDIHHSDDPLEMGESDLPLAPEGGVCVFLYPWFHLTAGNGVWNGTSVDMGACLYF